MPKIGASFDETQNSERLPILAGMLMAWLGIASIAGTPYLFAEHDASGQKMDQKKNKDVQQHKSALQGLPVSDLSEDEAILHTLSRLGFGPRPGDVERVRTMGLKNWIEQQLRPESISDEALASRLEKFPTLKMSPATLLEEFPQAKQAAQLAALNTSNTQDQNETQRRQRRLKADGAPATPPESEKDPAAKNAGFSPEELNRQQQALLEGNKPQRIVAELSMAKLIRAVYSERPLEEEMADFWFNHFNVFFGKGADKWMLTSYERDVIRPHVLGKFKELLAATAQSPAMLFYLDNFLSADPQSFARMQQQQEVRRERAAKWGNVRSRQQAPAGEQAGEKAKKDRGLNENYARELMELHTLGVDGGYTQADVIEVAKCFTGWTIKEPRRNPEFFFNERIHDPKPKTVLGKTIHAGGMKDGEQVIEMLAHHPSTAKFISTKLARHFVSDDPPPALVERMSKIFLASDGDIRAVLRSMIESPEFWNRSAYRSKIKTPFELVVSAIRATGAEVTMPLPLVYWVGSIGEPLYLCQPPTGYSDRAETWVNTGALLSRLNFTLALAANRVRGSNVDPFKLLGEDAAGDPKIALARATRVFLDEQVSQQTRETLEQQLANPQVLKASLDDPVKQIDIGVVAGLVLGTPEFQRR